MNKKIAQFMMSIHAEFLTRFFIFLTSYGMAIFLTGIGLYMIAKKEYKIFITYLISTTLAWLIAEGVKAFLKIQRPVSEIYPSPIGYSFPSSHATVVFALWPMMDYFPGTAKWILRFILLLFPLSRLYLGVHYLTDILAGAILGLIVGYTAKYI